MTTTSASDGIAATTSTRSQPPPSRRRDKPQLSCNLCRRRKLRCDRGQPCGTCAHRGLSLSCTYVNSPSAAPQQNNQTLSHAKLHDRIAQLEKLARSLAGKHDVDTVSAGSTSKLPDDILSENLGRINMNDPETNYVESTHWVAILDGISELKDYLDNGSEFDTALSNPVETQSMAKPTLLSHLEYDISKQQLIAALPPKAEVDRLVVICFMYAEVLHFLFHGPTFQKQYDNFWRNPEDTPTMWIGALYGLLCSGLYYERFASTALQPGFPLASVSIEAANQAEHYRWKMIECMVVGGYTRGVPHSIETITLYMHLEFLGKPDSPTEHWLLLGVLIRLALRLGYHRDGSNFPNLTPFEAEMRRRHWCSIMQMETMTATKFGLPKMIDPKVTDVAPPRNLYDEDFDETSTELPESRPNTTLTPSLYLITKTRLFTIFGTIADLTTRAVQISHSEVMELDRAVDEATDAIPPCFRMRSMTLSIIDKPEVIIQRVWLRLMVLKNKCVLHRRYLRTGRTDSRWFYSRRTCIDGALEVLSLQKILRDGCLPGGRLAQHRWRLTSMINQEFLLATAILCVDVSTDIELESLPNQKQLVDKESRNRVLTALRTALAIWNEDDTDSLEAKRASKALQIVLQKASALDVAQPPQQAKGSPFEYAMSLSDVSASSPSFPAGTAIMPLNGTNSLEWQSMPTFTLPSENGFGPINFSTPSAGSLDFTTPSEDSLQIDFQAQDLMDILQEDYPGNIL